MKKIILYFRKDLRLLDHPALFYAFQETQLILPLYVFSESVTGKTKHGLPKVGKFRMKFLLETLQNLRFSFQRIGADLIIRQGNPETILAELCLLYDIDSVYFHSEPGTEEETEEIKIETQLTKIGVNVKKFESGNLFLETDLPFSIDGLPEIFTDFRKKVENITPIHPFHPRVRPLSTLPEALERGEIPSLEFFFPEGVEIHPKSAYNLVGGEDQGIQRVTEFLWVSKSIETYKETRNQMLGLDYSSKFSAYFSNGCLSPRFAYNSIKNWEKEKGETESSYWFCFELLWREYFKWILKKHKKQLFQKDGIRQTKHLGVENLEKWALWTEGKTGVDFIDANMKELLYTGYMSNRGRQNVASFLVHEWGIDWRLGAEWFESQLIDYDVALNWGNWAYFAGVGNDPRARKFNVNSQIQSYDPEHKYISTWV
jgi:deoxyribodipyrimidine photo-lyase